MKIYGSRPVGAGEVRRAARGDKAAGGSFSIDAFGEEQSTVGTVAQPNRIAKIDALLALQEVADPVEGRRRAVRRSSRLLDQLDEIRHGLLLGAIPRTRLQSLAEALKSEREHVSDPRLVEVIDEIELRAQVELAKLQLAS